MRKQRAEDNRPRYKPYPEPQEKRVGCKVAWNYYKSKADAEACAEAAKWNADIQASYGYDFGYCCPGSITKEQGFFPGLYEVCLP